VFVCVCVFRFLGETRLALRDVLNSPNLAATFTVSLMDTKRNITGVRALTHTCTRTHIHTHTHTHAHAHAHAHIHTHTHTHTHAPNEAQTD